MGGLNSRESASGSIFALIVLSLLFSNPAPTSAQVDRVDLDCPGPGCPPQYSASDIEKFFKPVAYRPPECPAGSICLPKKKTRPVCIGSSAECARYPQGNELANNSFDLLITFELGSDRLSKQAQQNLREFAKAMNGDNLKHLSFYVDGHTTASGSDSYNMTLSQRRAAAVVRNLQELGIDVRRLQARGLGETAPRNSDPFADINRRIEATVSVR